MYAHLDFYMDRLFQGIVNKPPNLHSRDFLIQQADKVQMFLEALLPLVKHQHMEERTVSVASEFFRKGNTTRAVTKYMKLYGGVLDVSTTAKVGHRKFGYMRSDELTTAGQVFLLYMHFLCCKQHNASMTPSLEKRAKAWNVSANEVFAWPLKRLRTEVRSRHDVLWKT